MKRIHVNLRVAELPGSVRFYTALFGTAPTVHKQDYAKWMLEDPRVNFSLSALRPDQQPGIEHLGIQAETAAELTTLRQQLAGLEGDVEHEGETTCCYHHSDKTWVTDAQGVGWELFYTSGEAATYYAPAGEGRSDGCCTSSDCAESAGTDCCAPDCCEGNGADAGAAAA